MAKPELRTAHSAISSTSSPSWSNYMTFTPPNADQSRPRQDDYHAFARGIAAQPAHSNTMNLQQPHRRMSRTPSQTQYNTAPSPQGNMYPPPTYPYPPPPPVRQDSYPRASPVMTNDPTLWSKNSPAELSQAGSSRSSGPLQMPSDTESSGSSHGSSSRSHDNGLTLDLSSYPKEFKFQIPSFLTSNSTGVPTWPPGGEAWSGFTGPTLFGSDGQMTPGNMFNNSFCSNGGPVQTQPHDPYYSQNGVYDWNGMNGDGAMKQGQDMGGYGMVYVNPNPSPSVFGQRNQANNAQRPQAPQQPGSNGSAPRMAGPQQSNGSHQSHGPGPPQPTPLQPPSHQHNPTPSPRMSQPPSSGAMPTSAILPAQPEYPNNTHAPIHQSSIHNIPSISIPTDGKGGPVNFASSSQAPYVPSLSAQAMLQGGYPSALHDGPGLYSTTGFDMLGVLGRVAARKNPSTVLGPVDLSCSLLVVDIRRYDCPIVYASPSFTKLTGYELPEIIGRNCRFLQSPDGNVVKGAKREYTDNQAVSLLKRSLDAGKECQTSLINYRKGGDPFINLVTVVPIPWDGPDIAYHVGFQIDLVDQPNKILNNMRNGSYTMDYTHSIAPEKPLSLADQEHGGQSMGLSPDVLEVMGNRASALSNGTEEAGRMEWLKMVLDNTDDFVHALSLKGFFTYVTPSIKRTLGYDPEDLLNKNVSEFAHPSDVVPLIRALKDATQITDDATPKPVSLTYRMRRKNGGWVWVESMGRLVVEAGKGRKAVILSGRVKSVPMVTWGSVAAYGGLAEKEFWAKISFEGLLLHLTGSVDKVLGYSSEDILGQSVFSLVPGGTNAPNTIRKALQGEDQCGAVSLQQNLVHRAGHEVTVVIMFYAPKNGKDSRALPQASESMASISTDDSTGPSPSSGNHTNPIKPTSLFIQVKLLSHANSQPASQPPTIASMTNARALDRPQHENVLAELEIEKDTSWQYELHQMKMTNRQLKKDIAALRAKGVGRIRKRKAEVVEGPEEDRKRPEYMGIGTFGMGGQFF
ncbi:hypothetical protein I350_02735 [Cryptococcus amylolentus CBS 6273]|uniref:PAS domain-containing protein n=1 Tax=Cryptococcus amylolentus CBS 6273 TaxID=1296118 RepID=A0A1E3K814_9TREE|nr:hypothetical protein I350_02735 [Cryptococcus amylolentus CBS 6273]